jgi:hypothetical protein
VEIQRRSRDNSFLVEMVVINKKLMWQYNGKGTMTEIQEWCAEFLPYQSWSFNGWETIYFDNEAAFSAFLLRWS